MTEICYSVSALQTIHDYNATYCNAIHNGEPSYPLVSKRTLEVVAGIVQGAAFSAIALGLATLLGGFTTKLFQCTSFGEFVSTFFTEVYEETEHFIPNATTVWYNPRTEYVVWTNSGAIIKYFVPQLYYNGLVRTISSIFFFTISSILTFATIEDPNQQTLPDNPISIFLRRCSWITQTTIAAVAMRVTTIAYTAVALIQTGFRTIPDMVSLAQRVTHNPNWSIKNIATIEFLYIKHVVLSYLETLAAIIAPEAFFHREGIDFSKRMNDRNRELMLLTEPEDFEAFERFITETGTLEQVTTVLQQITSFPLQPAWFTSALKVKFLKRLFLSEPTTKAYIENALRSMDDTSLQEFCRSTNRTILIRAEQYAIDSSLTARLCTIYTELQREEPNDLGAFDRFVTETGSLEQVVHLFQQFRALQSPPVWFNTDLKVKFLKRVFLSEPTTKTHIETILWGMDDTSLQEFCRSTNRTILIRAEQYAVDAVLIMRCRALYDVLQNNTASITSLDLERITSKKMTLRHAKKLLEIMKNCSHENPFVQKCLNRYTMLENRWTSIEATSTDHLPKSVILRTAIQIEQLALRQDGNGLENIDKKIGTRRLVINWATKNVVIVSKRPKGFVITRNTSKICRPALLTPLDAAQLDQTKKVAFIKSMVTTNFNPDDVYREFETHNRVQGGIEKQGLANLHFFGKVKTSSRGYRLEQSIAVEKFYDFALYDIILSNEFKNMNRKDYAHYILKIISKALQSIDALHTSHYAHAAITPDHVRATHYNNKDVEAAVISMSCASTPPTTRFIRGPTTDPLLLNQQDSYEGDFSKADIFSFGAVLYMLATKCYPSWATLDNNTNQWTYSLSDLKLYKKELENTFGIDPAEPCLFTKSMEFPCFLRYLSYLATNPNPQERPTAKQLQQLLNNYTFNPSKNFMEPTLEFLVAKSSTHFIQQCATGTLNATTTIEDPYFQQLQEYVQNPKETPTTNLFKKKAESAPEVLNLFLRLTNMCLQDNFNCKNWEQSQAKSAVCSIWNVTEINDTKKLYRQFLLHFHPDKIDANSKFLHETFAYMQHLYGEATKS